jgi:hypothetical protein
MVRRTLAFLSLSAVFCVITLLWLWLDRTPPRWDDASYLVKSLKLYDTLAQNGVVGYAREFLTARDFRAPLITLLPTPIYLLVGRRSDAAFAVNIASMVILFWAVYTIAVRILSHRAAFLAMSIAGTMPLLYGLSRWYMVEYSLAAIVAVAHLLLISVDSDRNDGSAFLFGALSGAGLLLKASYPLFVLPGAIYVLVKSKHTARLVAIAGLPCAIVAGPWYLLHYRDVVMNAIDAGYGYSAVVQGTGEIFSFHAITTYLWIVIVSGISVPYALLACVVVIASFFMPAQAQIQSKKEFTLVLLWMLPFIVFLFGGNKDVRYIAPILPAFGVALSIGLDRLIPYKTWGHSLMGLAVSYPFVAMLSVSFGVPAINGARGGYSSPYHKAEWPQRSIVNDISESGRGHHVLIGSDLDLFNINNFELVSIEARLPLDFETTAYQRDREAVLESADRADVIVLREGGQPESKFYNVHVGALQEYVVGSDHFSAFGSYPLPGGGKARLYRNTARSPLRSVSFLRKEQIGQDEFAATIGEMFELTSLSVSQSQSVLKVRFRWHCLKTPDRDYWSFVHVLNQAGTTIGYLDHPLGGGSPPTSQWRPGDVAVEDLEFRMPSGESQVSLKLGIFHLKSGERLPVGVLDAVAVTRFSKADQETALMTPLIDGETAIKPGDPVRNPGK